MNKQQVKIFLDTNPDELEQKINSWLLQHPNLEVQQISVQIGSHLDTTNSGTVLWTGMSYATVLVRG
jgi:hypothetical protein